MAEWIDVEAKQIIDEGGYNEFPAMCHRFDKRPFMPWGFSPAMKALPFARILNAMAKTNLRSMMKHTDPALAIPSNAFILPFNQNPRALNYYNKSKMDGRDIFPIGNTGDPQAGLMGIEYYSRQVKSLMYNDVFLAFNNITKEMNNPEVMERINEKMTLLGPAVGRYLSEVLNPIIQRTIGILFRRGKLPEPPEELLMNPGYEIDFIGSLAQAQRRSELNTLTTGLTQIDRHHATRGGAGGGGARPLAPLWSESLAEVVGGDPAKEGFSIFWLLPTPITYLNAEALTGYCFRDTPRPRSTEEMEALL
jgi:hypothetical protein